MHYARVNVSQPDYQQFAEWVADLLENDGLEPTHDFIPLNYLRQEYGEWLDSGMTTDDWQTVKDFIVTSYGQGGVFEAATFGFHSSGDAANFKLAFGGI